MMKRFLTTIARLSFHHHRLTLLLVLFLTILSIFLTSKLELKTNYVSLLPQHSRTVRVFFESVADFGMSDFFIICLKTDDPQNTEKMMDLADLIVDELQGSDLIEYIDYRLGDKEKDFYKQVFLRNMVLFLDENGIQRLKNALSDDAIRTTIKKNKELLVSQVSLGVKKIIIEDPLHLSEIYKDYLPGQKGNLRFDLSDGYYLTLDQKMLLIMIKPIKSIEDFEFNRQLLAVAQKATSQAVKNYEELGDSIEEGSSSAVTIAYTGGHVITLADQQVIKLDIIRTVVTSFIGITLLFLFAFRRLETIIYIGLPLVIGVLWTLGFSYLTIGSLNLITSVLSAIIMGLGVDFSIHLYNRFLDEKDSGCDTLTALEVSISETGKGTLTGALTTAAAFFAMTLAPFRGLSEFGFMAGSGILLCYFSIVITLPALIKIRSGSGREEPQRYPMRSFYIHHLSSFVMKFPTGILIAGTIFTLFALTQIHHIRFSDSIVDIRAQSNQYMKVRDEIRSKIGGSLRYFLIVLRAPDEETGLMLNHKLMHHLKRFLQENKINTISSITEYIPAMAVQHQNTQLIRADQAFDTDRIEKSFHDALLENGFRIVPAYKSYIDNIVLSLGVEHTISYHNYRQVGLERFLSRFITFKEDEVRLAVYLFPKEVHAGSDTQDLQSFMAELKQVINELDMDADLTGTMPVTQTLKKMVIQSINRISLVAFIGVLVVLSLHFRRIRLIIGALLPMTLGMIWMLGTMPLLNLSLNFFNIAIIPIIIGIGLDDGVHILHRYREGGQRDLSAALNLSGKAVVMTSLTTIIAFGSLAFSDYKGLAAMGYLAISGVGFSLLCTLIMLPALIIVWSRLRDKVNNRA
ncbi:RND family transporter [candidate division CSSED10-310 bacterium]|uniref:RND family transporter n=1 Tax=candidate division CSSED10-310 bacterium TaxID=2855610 RepID=A0ABV6YS98_UNCC1